MTTVAPYGSWRSPLTTDVLVERVVGLANPSAIGGTLVWVESRPNEGGRQVIVAQRPGEEAVDVLPAPWSARTLVHEYGGLCHAVHDHTVVFSNFADQRLYRVDLLDPSTSPEPITPEPPVPMGHRYADPVISPDGAWIVCVRERHEGESATEVVNELVMLPGDGSGEPHVVAGGHDFYAAPRLSPDGSRLVWLTWDHPRMPWDGTELWEAPFAPGSPSGPIAGEPRLVAGGPAESVNQPAFGPDGTLFFASDRTGWWVLYADNGAVARPVALPTGLEGAEMSGPDWVFGQSTYTVLADGSLVASWTQRGESHLGVLPVTDGTAAFASVATPFTSFSGMRAGSRPSTVVAVAASPTSSPAVVEMSVPGGEVEVVKRSRDANVDPSYLSVPRQIEFPTERGLTAHALFYPPTNPDFAGPEGERPPLLVMSHGGPTSAAQGVLDYGVQFWTSRGFAVVDVDYGGSTGYGRAYRERLKGQWGIVDVDDCVNAARWLAAQGEVDPGRMAIRGGSAGGYTTLCALTFRPDVFAAGASRYGVADAGALARDTHKFESRYTDGLIGPWPEAEAVYEERSPIFHTDRLSTPLILFQGLEDKIVPPNQTEMMAAALDAKGVPYVLIEYEGEQHGFRRAENIKRTAAAELSFYGQVLGFVPADDDDPVTVVHADRLPSRRP